MGVRGGPGRTRTSNQTVMSGGTRIASDGARENEERGRAPAGGPGGHLAGEKRNGEDAGACQRDRAAKEALAKLIERHAESEKRESEYMRALNKLFGEEAAEAIDGVSLH